MQQLYLKSPVRLVMHGLPRPCWCIKVILAQIHRFDTAQESFLEQERECLSCLTASCQ
jgi:hypothetical protein